MWTPARGSSGFSFLNRESTNSKPHQAKPPQSLQGKCRECGDEKGGEAMGGEASGRGAREDRRGARTPKPHAMTSMMRRLHHAADGGGSGWVMAASA